MKCIFRPQDVLVCLNYTKPQNQHVKLVLICILNHIFDERSIYTWHFESYFWNMKYIRYILGILGRIYASLQQNIQYENGLVQVGGKTCAIDFRLARN